MAHGKNWRTRPGDIPGFLLPAWDAYVPALTVMDHEHRVVHDGMGFHANYDHASLANGASLDILLVTGAACYPHINGYAFWLESGNVELRTYEETVTTANGTTIPVGNRNRNSSNTPGVSMFHSPTVTDLGNLLHTRWAVPTGTGVGNKEGLVEPVLGEEWILKPNTKYLTRVTNTSGAAIRLVFEGVWYEPSYDIDS